MRIFFLSIAFIAISIGAFAQNQHAVGLSYGMSLAQTTKSWYNEPGIRPGLTGSLNYQRRFGWFVAEGTLDYTQKGNRFKVNYTDADANVVAASHVDNIFHYVGFSLKAGVTAGKRLFSTTTIGLTPAFLAKAEYRTSEIEYNDNVIPSQREKISNISTFDLSANLETSVGYKLNEHSSLLLSASANAGLVDVEVPSYYGPVSWKNHYFTAKLGYQYSF
jgi:hypothetical protein